ncbi:sialidase family protein [Jiangella endophytica]|uniref:sialidase family protein n=1 Tax=Jiangella endophytica TaxID=1623398 RepID=UPI0018E4E398|nr:sialidase family protein [Jiangella endophytica]
MTTTRRRRLLVAHTGAIALAAAAALAGAPASATDADAADAAAAEATRTTVFTRGEGGYHTFRIPTLVEASDGTLLALAEGRVTDPDDWGDMDIVLKRSTDRGTTWGPIQVVADTGADRWSNPVAVVDASTGRIIVNTIRTAADDGDELECGRAPVRSNILYSDDNGATWSEPRDITDEVKPDHWRNIAPGPGHGIQLTQGEHAGRLVIPGRHSYVHPGQECTNLTGAGGHALLSDDGGQTWRVGAVDEQGIEALRPNEVSVVELADGRLYFNARDQGSTPGQRVDTTSSDGGETFDEPYDAVNGVVTSMIQGSVTRLPAASGNRRDRVILSITNHPTSREKLTLFSSFDDGETWTPSYEVYDGPAAYSDVAVLGDRPGNREIGVLYESGERLYPGDPDQTYHHDITFVRVPERRLDLRTPPPAVTPDTAGDNDALISGVPKIVPGTFGKGLSLAGDFAELPLNDDLSFGTEPFTAAAWFRTDYLANNQAILYAHGRFGPRWWIQVEPNNGNVIRAQLSTDRGSTRTLTAPGDFVDDEWHHVALVRDVDGVALYVDGALAATGASIGAGSVSAGARTGIRVGARVDGIHAQFVGGVDEVWLFDTALNAEQVADLAATNSVQGATPVTHLPMNQIVRR